MIIRNILKRILYREKYDSDTYIEYLNKLGVNIDKSSWIVTPNKVSIDVTRPYLITIGKNVVLTEGVTILTHGFDWIVLRTKYGDVLGSAGKVEIGNNVFVGVHSLILKGVSIGNNVIIGAGSVVCKDIPDDCVAAGNPCKVICSLSQYYEKRKNRQYEEAKNMTLSYFERHGRWPEENVFSEFFWLFKSRDEIIVNSRYKRKMNYGADEKIKQLTMERYKNSQPMFRNFHDFINKIVKENE